jgi:pimeloyl-ACP methyl ester carboxylesterase
LARSWRPARSPKARPADASACVGFPTTILAESGQREADVERTLATGVPWLFLSGDRDNFSELHRLRAWAAARPSVRLDVLADTGHFFAGETERDAVARVTAFVRDALSD